MKVAIRLATYALVALATCGFVRYKQIMHPERWKDSFVEIEASILAGLFWPLAWLVFIPLCFVLQVAQRIGERALERSKLLEDEARETEQLVARELKNL